jgi:hypothetical protein
VVDITGVPTINEKVIYSCLILFPWATPIIRDKPCLLRFSTMRIVPIVVVHMKKAMCGGALTFQKLFNGNEQCSLVCNIL